MTQSPTPTETTSEVVFADRHIGPTLGDVHTMLDVVGAASLDDLIDRVVPPSIRSSDDLALPEALSEVEALDHLATYAAANSSPVSMIGMGYYGTLTPTVILRNVFENPAWYTAYTPYQPEISQGRLEALLNFQTMIADLCGLDLANASLLDEGTAAAEAMTMARRAVRRSDGAFFVDSDTHPQTIDVIRTRAEPLDIDVVVGDPESDLDPASVFGVLLSYPGTSGAIADHRRVAEAVHESGGFVVVVSDLLALCLLEAPGTWGADAVVGSAQRFGVPLGFGGPHAGFMATRETHKRSLPGRLVGVSVDSEGRRALRLALQTREQHIRREKATSNICTAQVLLAVMASMYAVYHGPAGLTSIARRVHSLTSRLVAGLSDRGVGVTSDTWFDTVTAMVPGRAAETVAAALDAGINIRFVDDDHVGISVDEVSTDAIIDSLLGAFGASDAPSGARHGDGIPATFVRHTPFLESDVFSAYRSETDMLRYLRRLADRDVALDRSMIPLGSCTMKLNATTEMIPVTWEGFSNVHPFAPLDQTEGFHSLFADLESWLAEITGYHSVSLQPNAGSQGEYAGLMAIRAYHRSRGDEHRTVCLIPSSAHGTNAASAVMAGMDVVVVGCDDSGNVDVAELEIKIKEHSERLGALMVTYPSTHGVFEESISDICAMVHDSGGQVYLDGANMNALVGIARPGRFGSDVSHLNLHKTFCIPHGGGGPGVGPIGVAEHLAPFLPGHRHGLEATNQPGVGAVAAAPWGSASILPISWAYIAMMGADGLRRATQLAILNANYVARRLEEHFPVLYTGRGGYVAHEAILDIRPIEKNTGVSCEDIAKRLIDFGFHAPTMSFPVAGTLMVEPTESESLAELDRFCDAMVAIRGEIAAIERGEIAVDDSALRHSPHTAQLCTADSWDRAYGREVAAFPLTSLRTDKYWPPVGRIDNGYGDRNLVCSCPPPEAFASEPTDTL